MTMCAIRYLHDFIHAEHANLHEQNTLTFEHPLLVQLEYTQRQVKILQIRLEFIVFKPPCPPSFSLCCYHITQLCCPTNSSEIDGSYTRYHKHKFCHFQFHTTTKLKLPCDLVSIKKKNIIELILDICYLKCIWRNILLIGSLKISCRLKISSIRQLKR